MLHSYPHSQWEMVQVSKPDSLNVAGGIRIHVSYMTGTLAHYDILFH